MPTIPIVFVTIYEPVAQGFVESLAHPGGNATGFTHAAGYDRGEMAGAALGDGTSRHPGRLYAQPEQSRAVHTHAAL